MHSVGCYAINSQCKIRLARLEQQLQRWRWLQNGGGGRVFATVNVKQSICCVFIAICCVFIFVACLYLLRVH